jgi:adenine-specific DNA-methyltransferase
MTFRYIGSKARLADNLLSHIGTPSREETRFVDVFCGTGAVAEAASRNGWNVWVNDNLHSAAAMAVARIVTSQQVQFLKLGGYVSAVTRLNEVDPIQGFLWREYSPASIGFCGIERRYFTEDNAAKLDAMRSTVAAWESRGFIDAIERTVLVADLLSATNRAANIAGTYGCFLSKWQNQAKAAVQVLPRKFSAASGNVESTVADVFSLELRDTDIAYLDPPYSKRQYASYYHILETLTLNDEPVVEGVCGLRPWRDKASPFCYKIKALNALATLIEGLAANRVLLSYSNEGHIQMDDLIQRLSQSGEVKLTPLLSVGRYRPNVTASGNGDTVTEYLVSYRKHAVQARKVSNG